MQKLKAKELLAKYKANECTPEQSAWLESWYMTWNTQDEPSLSELELKDVEKEMERALGLVRTSSVKLWSRIAVAASVLFFVSYAFYFFYTKPLHPIAAHHLTDIAPGGNKAVLILANGKRINLKDAKSGALATEGNTSVKKTKDGQLVYDLSNGSGASAALTYNAIETPRSGTYQVILPDGSSVWLNAASRLKFPSNFPKNERTVELQGEAYFEVAKDKSRPFHVVSRNQIIEVLGTHFNVNSYPDELFTKTTLLEGSVKVSSGSISRIIKPGEQSQLAMAGHIDIVSVDTEMVTAWKNGVFSFKRADLKTVLREIARWYDVTVQYEGEVPDISFTGKIYRNVNLQEALKSIGYLDVHYKIKGRTISIEAEAK